MKRRVNKSHKVPNVKLRPVQPGSSESSIPPSSYWVQETQLDADSSLQDACPRPFKCVVLCTTGIVDKTTLFKQALELGATSTSAFTDRVTHLVAEAHGGAKYTCALERKIPIMLPTWVTQSYEIWLRGDDVDFDMSVKTHRLPIFSGVTLSLSGIERIERRTQINKRLSAQGGTYVKNLERPIKVTHLLCSGDNETEKMRYAQKFNERGEAKIWMVWEEWFWDSLEFGGRFDEEKYLVGRPRPDLRSEFVVLPTIELPIASHPSDRSQATTAPKAALAKTSKDHHVSAAVDSTEADDELASVKRRIPAETLQMWQTLLGPRGYEIEKGSLIRSPTKARESTKGLETELGLRLDAWENRGTGQAGDVGGIGGGSVIDAFRRASASVTQVHKEPTAAPPRQRPFKRTSTLKTPADSSGDSKTASSSSEPQGALFTGMTFRALGEAKCPAVRAGVEGCGGRMVSEGDTDVDVDFIVVRLVSGSKVYKEERDDSERRKYRTECWLERCMFEERICSPEEHVTFVPLAIEMPIRGAQALNISCSGLDQSEMCWMRRLARALGITLTTTFSRRCTHLLCPPRTGPKFDKAGEWGIPVVGMEWVQLMATKGVVPDVNVGAKMDETQERAVMKSARAKGKEKEKEEDYGIVDITNNDDTQNSFDIQIPVASPDGLRSLFGTPGGLLGESGDYQQSIFASPPPSSKATTPGQLDNLLPPSPVVSESVPPTLREVREIERDRASTRIPSSNTPSPLKMPGGSNGGASRRRPRSCSPAKVPSEVTKALQDSITNLLGKRPPEEGDASLANKAGKRARAPARSKPSSRYDSGRSKTSRRATPPTALDSPFAQEELGSLTDQDELNIGSDTNGAEVDESMRVTYEDPVERDEKERLRSLLESQTLRDEMDVGVVAKGRKSRGRAPSMRRSMRIAGF